MALSAQGRTLVRMQRHASGFTNVLSLMGAFVASSMVLGLLAAGLAIPFVGGAGGAAKAAVGTFEALPAELTTPVLAQQTRILANDGTTELARLYTENRTVVPLSQVSPIMRKAQLAIEDDRYYEHGGVDTRGLLRALVSTVQGDRQGASTITQQYVKQALVSNALRNDDEEAAQAAQERHGIAGIVRKLQEAKFAIELEKKMGKDDIFAGYLNLIFYGANAYGVEAAAMRYFGVHAKDLNLPQSAMIAGLAQSPGVNDPINNDPSRALKRRNAVLDRMAAVGSATPAEVAAAKATPLGLNKQDLQGSCQSSMDKWICMYVRKWLEKNATSLGKDEAARSARLLRGGLTVKTTFDANLVKESRAILTNWVPSSMEKNVGSAAAVVEPGTGRILSIGQSSAPSNDLIWSVDSEYGGSSHGFAIGSTAKTYAVTEALKKGLTGNTMLNAPPNATNYYPPQFDANSCDSGTNDVWTVRNVEGTQTGWMSLRSSTVYSVNTAFSALADRIGVCDTKRLMKDMGLHKGDGTEFGDVPNAIILGSNGASPLTMAASYATLAAGGTYCEPYPVETITQYDGKQLEVKKGQCRATQVSPRLAYDTTQILTGVVGNNALAGGRPSAAKTGTADGSSHTWMIGYTPQRATAVWTGRTVNGSEPMENLRIGDRWYGNPYGATLSGPSWKKIMDAANRGLEVQQFRVLPLKADNDGKVTLPDLKGTNEWEARQTLQDAGLKVQVSGQRVNEENVEWGEVARTDPGAGSKVDKGSTVTLTLGTGQWDGKVEQAPAPRRNANPAPAPAQRQAPAPRPSAPSAPRATQPGAPPSSRG